MSIYDSNDNEKRIAYIRLRNKMESILSKSNDLNNKIGNLKSSLTISLTIDDEIFNINEYENISNNLDGLSSDINRTISNINSHI